MTEAGVKSNATTKALVKYLIQSQEKDGSWRIRTHRPPLEDSNFTATALALHGLQSYGKPDEGVLDKATAWLLETNPKSTEDHAFRIFGLTWGGQDPTQSAKALLALQQEDGGWAQLPGMKSDAYATGMALAALREANALKPSECAYRNGSRWLIEHQKPDGSWHVESRSRPIQKYFESDFPHGKDQFISIAATCWAILALY